ncbi:MAG: ABC transporter substrate binding protein [Chloroflexi bacterium]|nr:ABC transporter substrate binding protein [Chloroflexota bacterium]MCY4246822.1 ABC transporter substrate binding protein [Chloroflexota bacterium]
MKNILIALAVLVLLLPVTAAQSQDNPTIALLSYGSLPTFEVTEGAVLDILESYEFISADERESLRSRQDLQGEKLNVIWGSANFDLPTANLMVANVLDQEPDALVTLTTTLTQLAINATSDMEEPPVVLFASVHNPYQAGLLQSACVKPSHVAGSLSTTPYTDVLQLLLTQYPDIETIGTIYSAAEGAGAAGAAEIRLNGELMGLTVLTSAVTGLSDLGLAVDGLISRGAEAFVLPIDRVVGEAGTPIIVNMGNEYDIPVFHPLLFAIESGATVSIGFYNYYAQGENLGRLLAGHLTGQIDIAETAIIAQASSAIGVNLDEASRKGIEIAEAILEQAEAVVSDGETALSERLDIGMRTGEKISLAERQELDELFFRFLENRKCTPERIAAEEADLAGRL